MSINRLILLSLLAAAIACGALLGVRAERTLGDGVAEMRGGGTVQARVDGEDRPLGQGKPEERVGPSPIERWIPECREVCCQGVSASLAFSRDGRLLAVGTQRGLEEVDAWVELHDVKSGERLHKWSATDTVHFVCFLDDGKTLASAEGDRPGGVRLWDYASGTQQDMWWPESDGSYANKALAVSPDGRLAVVATWARHGGHHKLRVFDLKGRRVVRILPLMSWAVTNTPPNLGLFSPDGRWFAASSDSTSEGGEGHGQYMLFNARTWELIRSVYTPDQAETSIAEVRYDSETRGDEIEAHGLAFSRDGRFLAVGCAVGVAVRDTATGERVHHFRYGPSDVALSPDGRVLASTHPFGFAGIALHDLTSDTLLAWSPRSDGESVTCGLLALSPDGKLLATGGWDDVVRLWKIE